MVGDDAGGPRPLGVKLLPIDQILGRGGLIAHRSQPLGPWDLRHAVAVDVRGICLRPRPAGGHAHTALRVPGHVDQPPRLQREHIGEPACFDLQRDIYPQPPVGQPPGFRAHHVLQPVGQRSRGREHHHPVLIVVVFRHIITLAGDIPLEHDQFLAVVLIQVHRHVTLVIGGTHQLVGAAHANAVHRQAVHPRAQLPADNELPAAVAGQIFVSHRIDGGARPLQNSGLVIELVAPLPEQAHPHRLLLSGGHHPEEHRRRLLPAVAVHVQQLYGRGVAAVVDGGVFRPQLAHGGVDGCLKALILLGQGGQGVQLVHRVKHAAVQAQPQHSGQPRQQHPLFHSAAPLPSCLQSGGIISQISRPAYVFFVNAKIFWASLSVYDIFSVSLDGGGAFVLE